jgi:uncharacterized membrane protein
MRLSDGDIIKHLDENLTQQKQLYLFVGGLMLALVFMGVQGITVGLLILLLGFAGCNRVLMGLGIMALLFYISVYYYQLQTTLLDKSLTLLITGIILLSLRGLLLRLTTAKGVPHG